MTTEERQDADVILTKLREYFIPKRNKVFKRYVFNSRSQKADESFNQLLTALGKLAGTCDFDALEDEMLPDPIVSGSPDLRHYERLLREPTLTQQKATYICRTNEMAASQRHRREQSGTIHFTRKKKVRGPHANSRNNPCPTYPRKYGGDTDAVRNCRAYGKTCAKCSKKNRLAKVSQSTCKQDSNKPEPERQKPGKHQRVKPAAVRPAYC